MPSAENLLETARQLRRTGDVLEAYDCLRQAVATGPETYEFLAKAAELFERLHAQAPLPGIIRTCRVAYLCNHTVVFHLPILSLLAWLDGSTGRSPLLISSSPVLMSVTFISK